METTKPSRPWEDNSSFRSSFQMIDVGEKPITRRLAQAQGQIFLSENAFKAVLNKSNPKGDVLALAEVAGIQLAKKTAEMIPLCHPLPLDRVSLRFVMGQSDFSILVYCEAVTHAKTGVEMEALAGVQGALLTLYDLCKAVDPEITISNIRLNFKEGGKSGLWKHPKAQETFQPAQSRGEFEDVSVQVITVSDRVSAGLAKDESGVYLQGFLSKEGAKVSACLVPDEKEQIQKAVFDAIRGEKAQLVILTGGTGLGPRDRTPEAIQEIATCIVPGVGEKLRSDGSLKTPFAWLSRSLGAIVEGALVICLPGSLKAVTEGMESLRPLLPHALHVINGGDHVRR